MPFVPAVCTQCGGSLSLFANQPITFCPFCGTPFVQEQQINVIVQGDQVDTLLRAAEDFRRLGESYEAAKKYTQACNAAPGDPRAWMGLFELICETNSYGDRRIKPPNLRYFLTEESSNWQRALINAIKLGDEMQRQKLVRMYMDKQRYAQEFVRKCDAYRQEFEEIRKWFEPIVRPDYYGKTPFVFRELPNFLPKDPARILETSALNEMHAQTRYLAEAVEAYKNKFRMPWVQDQTPMLTRRVRESERLTERYAELCREAAAYLFFEPELNKFLADMREILQKEGLLR